MLVVSSGLQKERKEGRKEERWYGRQDKKFFFCFIRLCKKYYAAILFFRAKCLYKRTKTKLFILITMCDVKTTFHLNDSLFILLHSSFLSFFLPHKTFFLSFPIQPFLLSPQSSRFRFIIIIIISLQLKI